MTRRPRDLRTSELLRSAASWLTVFGHGGGAPRLTGAELDELAMELRVRARWIAVARGDQGVSEDRRRGIAAIEDVEVQP